MRRIVFTWPMSVMRGHVIGVWTSFCRYRHAKLVFTVVVLCTGFYKTFGSQGPLEPPGDTRPKLPPFEPLERERGAILPPIPLVPSPDIQGLTTGIKIYIREIHVTGNTLLADKIVNEIITPYTNQTIAFEDLIKLRDELTLAYINRGYISSGAIIPKQSLVDGILEIQVIEGHLAEIHVETDGRFRKKIIRDRIRQGLYHNTVNVYDIEEQLQLLQQDPQIQRVGAELLPDEDLGQSVLILNIFEERPLNMRLEASNYQSPTIGSWRGVTEVEFDNLMGIGDEIGSRFRISEGLWQIAGHYDIPLNNRNTKLSLYARGAESEIVEAPFDDLDIESNTQTYGLTLEHPVYRTLQTQVGLFFTGEWRRSKSFLDGSGFSFIEGPEEGESKIAVLRAGFDWVHRSQHQVIATRSTFSLGIDTLDATNASGDIPDGQFFSWLGQAQWAQRLGLFDSQLILRFDGQLTESSLLGLEQFAVGGHSTVRGYRENTLVRDNGVIASIELRVPVIRRRSGASILEIAPFFDWGRSWNTDLEEVGPKTLASLGIGARLSPKESIYLNIHWAEDLKEVENPGEHDLQDEGVHLSLTWEFP